MQEVVSMNIQRKYIALIASYRLTIKYHFTEILFSSQWEVVCFH